MLMLTDREAWLIAEHIPFDETAMKMAEVVIVMLTKDGR
jgi:hypothetical protein